MSKELKPCPKCNSNNIHMETLLNSETHPMRCYCRNCRYAPDVWNGTNKGAIAYWNTRPIEDALQARAEVAEAEVERLRAALKDLLTVVDDHITPVIRAHASILLNARIALGGNLDLPDIQKGGEE